MTFPFTEEALRLEIKYNIVEGRNMKSLSCARAADVRYFLGKISSFLGHKRLGITHKPQTETLFETIHYKMGGPSL